MAASSQTILFLTFSRDRYFVVPKESTISAGDFVLHSIWGTESNVGEEWVVQFEASRDEARSWIRSHICAGLDQTTDRIIGFLELLLTAEAAFLEMIVLVLSRE